MTRIPRRALITACAIAAAAVLTATPALTAPPLFCEAYALKAVQQQKTNLAKGCGFVGQRWMKKFGLHYAWCLGATPGAANGETWARAGLLQQCAGGGGTKKKFVAPMYKGLRLDWCRKWATECGGPAAKAFCVKMGYPLVKGFGMAEDIGTYTDTRLITGPVCSGPQCDGFTYITCSKTP